jgi:sirohydrochlorin ferrochelatase
MRPAIVLVDHGSREPAANAVLDQLAVLLRARFPEHSIHVAHMEHGPPFLSDAIAACRAEGAREIIVHPYFLTPGRHSVQDIPRLVAEAAAGVPKLTVRVTEPLGVHEGIVDAICDRIAAVSGSEDRSRSG